MKDLMITFLSKLYDRNSIGYRFLRELYRTSGVRRIKAGLKCIVILPCIPIWNRMADKEVENVRRNGYIYHIRSGKVKFFLPDLNLVHGEFIQNRIFLERDYFEIYHLSILKEYIKKNAVIIDIGANIGNHTIFFAKECNARKVYTFEPTFKTFQILKENIRINRIDQIVIPMNVALGSKDSNVEIIVDASDAGSNRVEENMRGDTVMNKLDSLSIHDRIDFIKIDVEGYEYEVLMGAEQTIIKDKPDIFIEIFDVNYDKVHSLLSRLGYECIERMEQDYLYAPTRH